MHERGRSALKRNEINLALLLFLEADHEFRYVLFSWIQLSCILTFLCICLLRILVVNYATGILFRQCNSDLLKSVDNVALLQLDIVWCYLCLRSMSHIPDADRRLGLCEASLERSYGKNLERVQALKGTAGLFPAFFFPFKTTFYS